MGDRERRGHKRVAVDLMCAVTMPNGVRYTATARNLSIGGMFVECDRPLPKGERVRVSVNLQVGGRLQKVEADSEVIHGPSRVSMTAYGSGVEFVTLDAETESVVEQFVGLRPALA